MREFHTIMVIGTFGQSETKKLGSVQLQFCLEIEISSKVDL
jgi:hypothetical protein